MSDNLSQIRSEIESERLDSPEAIETFRLKYLSKKQGRITSLLKGIPSVEPAERRAYGQQINELKALVEQIIDSARTRLAARSGAAASAIDLTLPGRVPARGSIHPITKTRNDILQIFERMGFVVAEGPEIEDEWHNFTALNFPADHPARDMQDTLFISPSETGDDGVLLRTHTSPAQIRVMREQKPPVRVLVPGRVYRNEALSYKSFCLFHQVEGLFVDEGVTFADLKHDLHVFARAIFHDDVKMRFRPSFFPFTEPSAEVDIWWEDSRLPEGGRWLEILGCGMVDPNVFTNVGIDSERYTGYAFGIGIERIAMLRHDIPDIRLLYENDFRFLDQF
ncbi:MAG: phenylalanine--tRNA ligase subunit alpha [Rhodothermales bacterium]|nr:phenylalanine--tRNA ligase subunit alpha [Rhodothermales bacterium]